MILCLECGEKINCPIDGYLPQGDVIKFTTICGCGMEYEFRLSIEYAEKGRAERLFWELQKKIHEEWEREQEL